MFNQNSDHKAAGSAGAPPPMSPRISFSSDFVPGSQIRQPVSYRDAPVSDFEFSVNNFPMMTAEELIFKGRLLPVKEGGGSGGGVGSYRTTTLRDELQHEDGDEFSLRPPKNPVPARWRGFLGLRKSHIGSKKTEKKSPFSQDGSQCSTNSQEISD